MRYIFILLALTLSLIGSSTYYKVSLGSYTEFQNAEHELAYYQKVLQSDGEYLKLSNSLDFRLFILKGKKYYAVTIRPIQNRRYAQKLLDIVHKYKKDPFIGTYKSKKILKSKPKPKVEVIAIKKIVPVKKVITAEVKKVTHAKVESKKEVVKYERKTPSSSNSNSNLLEYVLYAVIVLLLLLLYIQSRKKDASAEMQTLFKEDTANSLDAAPYIKMGSVVLVLMFFIFFVWGTLAPLKSSVVVSGKIIASGQNKDVQHLYGGVVDDILVKNGDIVTKGQVLLKLDDLQAKANYSVSLKNRYELLSQVSRFNSILDGRATIVFNPELNMIENREYRAKLFQSQTAIFNAQKRLLITQDDIIKKKISSLKDEIKGVNSYLYSQTHYLKSLSQEIEELQELYDKKHVSKVNLREARRKKMILESELINYKTSISKSKISILELQEQSILQKREFLNKIVGQLSDARAKLSEIDEKLIAAKDTVVKSILRASDDGVVQDLSVYTKGGVIRAGEPVMSIVPKDDKRIIEARLDVTDIDQVHTGMKCDVMLVAFDTKNTFLVEGIVNYVSRDSKVDPATNAAYYSVEILFSELGEQQILENQFTLQTGMPAEAMILTGSRTLFSYIVQPFNDISRRAFNED